MTAKLSRVLNEAGQSVPSIAAVLVDTLGNPVAAFGGTPLPDGTDRSGSIVTANTAQDIALANTARVGMTFQNTSDTVMRLTESGTDATAKTGFSVGAGQAVKVSTNKRISVFCASAGKTFASTEV